MDGEQFLKASGLKSCPDNQMPIITDKNGNFIAFKFDLAKPGNFYYVLDKYLNVMQGETGYQLPALFILGGNQIGTDSATITIKGNSPKVTDNTIYAIPKIQSANGSVQNIIFPMDIFRVPGKYSFIFQVNQNGNVYKTAPFILNVQPEMISISANFKNGTTPYDSVFDAWRAKINKEFQVIQDDADNAKILFENYQGYAKQLVNQEMANVPTLSGNNNMTGANSFGEIILNGNNITHTVTKRISQASGTFMNGIEWGYITLAKYYNDTLPFGIISAQFNVPNTSTFKAASEEKPIVVAQFSKGACADLGQTIITMSGAEFKFSVADDTLLFCGLVTNSFSDWGFKVRDVALTVLNSPNN